MSYRVVAGDRCAIPPVVISFISTNVCDITFDQSAHAVFSLAVKHLWFSVVWSFRNFCVSPFEFASRSLISFEFVIKWRQAGLSRSQMRSCIRKRKRKSEYEVEDCVRSRVIHNNFFQTSNSALLDSTSLHERIDEHLSKFIFNWHSKKRWLRLIGTHKFEKITFKHLNYGFTCFNDVVCLKLQQWLLLIKQSKRNQKPKDWVTSLGHQIA